MRRARIVLQVVETKDELVLVVGPFRKKDRRILDRLVRRFRASIDAAVNVPPRR